MEKKPALVFINGKQYELKFTIGFWKKLKSEHGIMESNFDEKLKEDFPTNAPVVVQEGIMASGSSDIPSIEDIDRYLDKSVMDVIEQAYINGMTKAELELVATVQAKRERSLKKIAGNDD